MIGVGRWPLITRSRSPGQAPPLGAQVRRTVPSGRLAIVKSVPEVEWATAVKPSPEVVTSTPAGSPRGAWQAS